MKASNILVLILLLLCINASTEWPTHTVCKESNLEIYYKSCDPQQDFAFSIDQCPDIPSHTFNIRAAIILSKYIAISSCYKQVMYYVSAASTIRCFFLSRVKLCLTTQCHIYLSEHIYYEGPVTLGIKEIPQGEYTISAVLTNEDGLTVACADFNVKNYLDY
ncbi:LY86 protein, partial [Nothoprocta pentlandii]|nr:LY86 protein [Nothoprocta pentlandii]